MNERTRAEHTIARKTVEDLRTLALEINQLSDTLPRVSELNNYTTVEDIEHHIEQDIDRLNYTENPEYKNIATTKYDMRTAGTYICHYTDEQGNHHDMYKESLLDKFHTWVSLMFYQLAGIPEETRTPLVVPVSACNLTDRLKYEHASEDEDED